MSFTNILSVIVRFHQALRPLLNLIVKTCKSAISIVNHGKVLFGCQLGCVSLHFNVQSITIGVVGRLVQHSLRVEPTATAHDKWTPLRIRIQENTASVGCKLVGALAGCSIRLQGHLSFKCD